MSDQPNVIVIITDDQGYGDLACHGNPVALTPNMDRLHDESVRLDDFHVAPMCTPTRGQLLTGLDAARNGALNVSSGRSLLRADLPTMANLFRDAGYATGLFGKWHLGDNYPYRPEDRGFDETLWFPSSHISSAPDYWENDYFDDVYQHNGVRERYQGYCTEVFFRETKQWIGQCVEREKPFFAFLPTNAPHAPLWVPPEDRETLEAHFAANEHLLDGYEGQQRERIIRFLAMIRNVDTELGNLRGYLEEIGAARDTMVIFMTDNGSTFGPAYYNAGMKGPKCSLWEGGHRVPCFIHWPHGDLGEPRSVPGLTQVQDILPTLVDLCGLSPPERLDGVSLADTLRGKASPPEDRMIPVCYSRMPNTDYPTPDSRAVVCPDHAAMLWRRWRLLNGTELYDLESDPLEDHNVIAEHPDIAQRLQAGLDEWWRDVEAGANEPQSIIIGNEAENPMMLTACEWRDVFLDQQLQIRAAARKNSYWHLQVDQPGDYTFELRRWPQESKLKLREPCPAATLEDGELEEGKALPIARARLMIDSLIHFQELPEDADCATFTLALPAGNIRLHTWFDDDEFQPICGAYYVYVERLEGAVK